MAIKPDRLQKCPVGLQGADGQRVTGGGGDQAERFGRAESVRQRRSGAQEADEGTVLPGKYAALWLAVGAAHEDDFAPDEAGGMLTQGLGGEQGFRFRQRR